jgi:hypothetical protein
MAGAIVHGRLLRLLWVVSSLRDRMALGHPEKIRLLQVDAVAIAVAMLAGW